jgi:vacuolar protein sorting-associated protein 45
MNPAIPAWNKLRLVMLYGLRYQKSQAQNVASLINLALENGVQREDARVSHASLGIECFAALTLVE